MKASQGFARRLLLLIAPLVLRSVAASPAQAATLAFSEGLFEFGDFSQSPYSTETFSGASAFTFSKTGASAAAFAQQEALFFSAPTWTFDLSSNLAFGESNDHLGVAETESKLIGQFFIESGQEFSFDFAAYLNMGTSIDFPKEEYAGADGNLFFGVFDTTDQPVLLDFLAISSAIATPEGPDSLDFIKSDSIALYQNLAGAALGGNQEAVQVQLAGSFSRYFDSPTHLTLIQTKTNKAIVKVPEPSSAFALLSFGLICLRFKVRKKPVETRDRN
ncbi:PEP-CTERM sorting domain-containing protein [Kamptonema formosum]|uniref:PEP-CTERM sorting domain-containing protein n=1 Tax=Kamptonema formosum TaxID=331992 RepID=UPI00034AB722|nr:PEP-CTERM sorting domain-containing protein [Oscillatoria sp. PCC 10802]